MNKPFSDQLQDWLESDEEKTVANLGDVFDEKSFALAFTLLMASSALPLPTGGITQVFEVMTMLLALELVFQREYIWLPKRWRNKKLHEKTLDKTIPYLIKLIKKIEKRSKPRLTAFLDHKMFQTVFGLTVFFFAGVSLTAIPFSFLDTLPAMGVLGISLGVILGDVVISIIGLVLGIGGSILSIGFSSAVINWISRTF